MGHPRDALVERRPTRARGLGPDRATGVPGGMSDGCIVRRPTWLMVVFALLVGLVLPIGGFAPQPAGAASTGVSAPWLHVQLVHQDDALPKQPVRSGLVPMGSRSGFLAATRAAMALSVAAEGETDLNLATEARTE